MYGDKTPCDTGWSQNGIKLGEDAPQLQAGVFMYKE
jgi:hypothetical protein